MTRLRKMMLEELQGRNCSEGTTRNLAGRLDSFEARLLPKGNGFLATAKRSMDTPTRHGADQEALNRMLTFLGPLRDRVATGQPSR